MKTVLREGDTLARLGGDEFAVVFLDLGNQAESATRSSSAWPARHPSRCG
jgi:GGDEF domain-containing protein